VNYDKAELVDAMATSSGLSRADSGKALDGLIESVTEALTSGDSVQLIGFGTFLVKDRAARTGRNPKTGEPLEIAAAKVPAFKPGKALKDACN
jgi:DNA-binding protein HU-beta